MADEQHREVARDKVVDEMAKRGWNVADLAREARVDVGTVGDFVNGTRWPQRSTQSKIDVALGWWPGSISYYARGLTPPDAETVGPDGQDSQLLASLPPEALEGLGAAERAEVVAAMKLSALEKAREVRRRLDQ